MKTILSIITILLLSAAYSNAQNTESKLGEAASSGNLKKVNELVEKKGADVNCQWKINGAIQIPLIVYVVMENKSEVASYLIEKGANVNAKDGFGMTSLMWASYNGNVELVKLLLEKGADKTVEVDGQTALSAAEEKGFTEIVKLLK